jgi:hypothetical protein
MPFPRTLRSVQPRDAKVLGALLQQNSTGCIVPAQGVAGTAVFDLGAIHRNAARLAGQNGEAPHPNEAHGGNGESVHVKGQNSVACGEFGEG